MNNYIKIELLAFSIGILGYLYLLISIYFSDKYHIPLREIIEPGGLTGRLMAFCYITGLLTILSFFISLFFKQFKFIFVRIILIFIVLIGSAFFGMIG